MAKKSPLDKFGQFLMQRLRDRAYVHLDGLLDGHWKAPALKKLQRDLRKLDPDQQAILRRALVSSIDSAIHDFLFAIQEVHDDDGSIAIEVDGKNVAALSDGLHGELFTDDGWFARFSAEGKPSEEA